jgi:hypothetical protein
MTRARSVLPFLALLAAPIPALADDPDAPRFLAPYDMVACPDGNSLQHIYWPGYTVEPPLDRDYKAVLAHRCVILHFGTTLETGDAPPAQNRPDRPLAWVKIPSGEEGFCPYLPEFCPAIDRRYFVGASDRDSSNAGSIFGLQPADAP